MNRLFRGYGKYNSILLMIIVLLLPFALFINLGLMPLISDEPTRAIVTLEMILSGNYVTPTINGEFYYNKPPLFNWILAGFVHLSGRQNEFIFRLPTVISLVLFGLTIYLFSRKALGKINALMASLMFFASFRILFWDSFQGLIDITYSLITFTSFAALFHLTEKRKFAAMFIFTYLLAAAGFLMKGLPSVAFQGISLVVWLIHEKEFRKLFSWQHLAGISVFVVVTGIYYAAYLQTNSLQDVFSTLLDQSNRINKTDGNMLSWIGHLFIFPIEMIYEFSPWTILLLLLLNKKVRQLTFSDKLFRFSLIIFAANIVIYWVSADMRPRYLFMLFPLLFIILIKAFSIAIENKPLIFKILFPFLLFLGFAGSVSMLIYPFWHETNHLQDVKVIAPVLMMLSLAVMLLAVKYQRLLILSMIIVLLVIRTGFNLYNLPARFSSYPDAGYRDGEIMAGRIAKDHHLYLLGDTPFNHDASFYISRESRQIVRRTTKIPDEKAYYITDEKNLANFAARFHRYEIMHTFTIKLNETKLYLIKK